MEDETDGLSAAPEETVAPATEDSAQVENEQPEATTGDDDGDEHTADTSEPKKPAKGVQKRLDELTRRIHEERREKERLMSLLERGYSPQGQPQQVAHTEGPPREDQFDDWDAYQAAVIDWRVEQRLAAREQSQQRESLLRTYEERAAKAKERLPDYDIVVTDPTLTITPLMAEVIRESDVGPEVAYHLGTNRSEAQRIAALPPHRQAAELGRLEARLSQAPAPAPATPRNPPPAPPRTVSGVSAGLTKAPEEMSMAEYVAARAAGQI